MKIGALNKRIKIEAKSMVADGMGGFTVTWTTVAEDIPAAIWPVSAAERTRADAVSMIATDRIVIRYRKKMSAAWRIAFADKYYNITSIVDPDMKHKWLHLLCKEA